MEKKIILWLAVALCLGTAVTVILATSSRARAKNKDITNTITVNPFYGKFTEIGARNGIDVSFTEKATCQPSMSMDLERHPLLSGAPRSFDILIVGDSSLAWGLIPEVVEQMTGRTVGVFAFEALTLNTATARIITNLVSYYLKKDGLLVLAFGSWTQELPADSIILVHTQWMTRVSRMDENSFAQFMERLKGEKKENTADGKLLRELLYSRYRANMARLNDFLTNETGMSLFHIDLYKDYIEPIVNPGWHKKKLEMKSRVICLMQWNRHSVMIYSAEIESQSRRSLAPPDPTYQNKNIAQVSSILSKIPCRKAYLVNFKATDATYTRLRSIYQSYYANHFELIDLGKEHPLNETFPMDAKEHMINEGALGQSILIGKCIKRDFLSGVARPVNNTRARN